MKEFKIDLNYIKKNFDLNKFIKINEDTLLFGVPNDLLYPFVISCANIDNVELKFKSAWPKKPLPNKNQNDIYEDWKGWWLTDYQEAQCEFYIDSLYSKYQRSKNYQKDKIDELIYQGKLFTTISDNFKLEYYEDISNDIWNDKKFGSSHYLIKSKKNNRFYYIFCNYDWDNKKHKISKIKEAICYDIFKKKLTKKEFLKVLLDKKT